MKGFKKFILDTHPDPDFAMRDFDQLCILAENYRNKALDEAVEKASNPELDKDDMHVYLNNGLFSKGYDTACRTNKESILSLKEKY